MKKDVVPIARVARRSSCLRGKKAILNRDLALKTNRESARRSSNVERRIGQYDDEIATIGAAGQWILTPGDWQREIGFHLAGRPRRHGTGKRR